MGDCQMAGCGLGGVLEAHRARPCGHVEAPTVTVCSLDRHGDVAPNPSPCTTCGECNRLRLTPVTGRPDRKDPTMLDRLRALYRRPREIRLTVHDLRTAETSTAPGVTSMAEARAHVEAEVRRSGASEDGAARIANWLPASGQALRFQGRVYAVRQA